MIATLFLSDVFTAEDVRMARQSLTAYSVGLLAFILIKVLAPAYYAQQDTRTPVRIGMIAMAANMVFNLVLIFPLQHAGLALATSLSAYLNAWLLWRGLRRGEIYRPGAGWGRLGLQVLLACTAMGGVLWFAAADLAAWMGQGAWLRAAQLAGWIGAGIGVYFAVLFVLGWRPREILQGVDRH
jgi:putative peptidoglycan lipid II flippase